jgi:hypothetical protein
VYDVAVTDLIDPDTEGLKQRPEVITGLARTAGHSDHLVAGHSLKRSGHATTAARKHAPDRVIMAQTGHRSVTTLDGYVRAGRILEDNSARFLGLQEPYVPEYPSDG